MSYEYPALAVRMINDLEASQLNKIDAAVDAIAPRMIDGGVLQVFGTGHARLPMHEMAGRAGGLRPVNLIRIVDLSTHGGLPFQSVSDPTFERDPDLARRLWDLSHIDVSKDILLIASNSGINGFPVEFALIAKEQHVPIVAITSLSHSKSVPSRHPSGKKLFEIADIVIDNLAPAGDAAITLDGQTAVGAVSNLNGVVIVQMLTEGIARRYESAGTHPPVYRSMNLPDGDSANSQIETLHAGRIRPIEP